MYWLLFCVTGSQNKKHLRERENDRVHAFCVCVCVCVCACMHTCMCLTSYNDQFP